MRVVPVSLRKCTPVAVRATAGLRLLPDSQPADILDAVAAHLRAASPFALPDKDAVAIMDGADAGVFAWLTANYLRGIMRPDSPANSETLAVLDLGAVSVHIVVAPAGGAPLHEDEHKYELDFGGRTHVLYEHLFVHRLWPHPRARASAPCRGVHGCGVALRSGINNPCLSHATQRAVESLLEAPPHGRLRTKEVTMVGADVGGYACRRIMDLVLPKDTACAVFPCAFEGPALSETFPPSAGCMLLVGYRIAPLLPHSQKEAEVAVTAGVIAELGGAVCIGREEWLRRWGAQTKLMAELNGQPEWCLDLTFMHALLTTGYGLADEREVIVVHRRFQWTLDAGIRLIGDDVKCRV
ncbi:nucleoside phosphatase GDA1/CD39 [Mycena polygramma]|nr:nucleoside phosphatase GDA1/CD39 [Mycena polygramma]